jgi:LmbE family N-acetylglucosaminyl deacetylase
MLELGLVKSGASLRVLCLGAHSDDIEIGAGGTILNWIENGISLDVRWVVFSAPGARAEEAVKSAESFLAGAARREISLFEFRDGYFPHLPKLKDSFEDLKRGAAPDVILTHRRDDAHQDHRQVAQMTWNSFRDHLILEYEIPKWDGDLGRPNIYQPLKQATLDRKIELLHEHFATQRSRDWFDPETFRALARLRGMESRSPERAAEAFVMSKALLGLGGSYVKSTKKAPESDSLHSLSPLLQRRAAPSLKV